MAHKAKKLVMGYEWVLLLLKGIIPKSADSDLNDT